MLLRKAGLLAGEGLGGVFQALLAVAGVSGAGMSLSARSGTSDTFTLLIQTRELLSDALHSNSAVRLYSKSKARSKGITARVLRIRQLHSDSTPSMGWLVV
jgi:hypothetical protein